MKRKFLISTLLLITFLTVSAYVIILAQGTKIDGGGIVNTSILRVNSVPEDVVVYINGAKVEKRENRVEWLQPGEVTVTLKKEGYRPWEKNVFLKAGLVEDIFAQLYPDRLNFSKVTSANVDKFFFADNTDYIFYTVLEGERETEQGVWRLKLSRNILDIGEIRPTKLYTFDDAFITELTKGNYSVKVSPDNSKLVLDVKGTGKFYLLDVNNPNQLVDITANISFYPTAYSWFEGSNSLILSNNKVLVQYDIPSRQSNMIYYREDGNIKYTSSLGVLYYYHEAAKTIHKYQNKTSSALKLPAGFTYPEVINAIYTPKDVPQMLFFQSMNELIFIDVDKEFVERIPEITFIVSLAPNGRGLVYKEGEDLFSIVIKDSLDFRSYTHKTYSLELDPQIMRSIMYTPSSKNLIALTNDKKEGSVVWFMDYDGMNLVKLIQNELIWGENINIANNGVDLYLTLQDSSASQEELKINNIYNFKLEVK